jgi:hypothetical protein
MKHNYKLLLLALLCVAFTWSACRKLKDEPNTSTVSTKIVSSQMAASLSESLYGAQGGFSIEDGIDYPSNLDFAHKGKIKVQSNHHLVCGFKIDTTFSANFDSDSAKLDLWEKIKYEVLCTNSIPSSVNVNDSLSIVIVGGGNNITAKYGKSFLLKSLTPGQTGAKLQLDGKLNFSVNGTYKENTTTKAIAASYNFSLSALVIDRSADADIISGNGKFSTKGTYDKGTWNYSGTIVFIGGHKAKVTINGDVYTINIKTGQVL